MTDYQFATIMLTVIIYGVMNILLAGIFAGRILKAIEKLKR